MKNSIMYSETKRIVLVDFNLKLVEAYSLIINSSKSFEVVGTYYSINEALKGLRKDNPDIIITEIEMAEIDEVQDLLNIKKRNSRAKILINTNQNDLNTVAKVLSIGIDGFVLKDHSPISIIDSLELINSGGFPLSQEIVKIIVSSYQKSDDSPLSKRETQVLQCISEGKTYSEIANELRISPQTSRTHIKNIYSKLNVNSRASAIEVARANKYL